jgi:hypothetical protein
LIEEDPKMARLRWGRLAFWVMAALVAAMMALGPSTAEAHPVHDDPHPASETFVTTAAASYIGAIDLASVSSATEKARSETVVLASIAMGADLCRDERDARGCCLTDSCCCPSACLVSLGPQDNPPEEYFVTLFARSGGFPRGVDPASLLRPPQPIA